MKALYKWFAYKLPIRSKLLISFSILVMVPILVLGIYSYQQSKENTERQIRSTMESNLTRLTSELDTRFQREGSTVRFLAYNLTFRNALENSGSSASTIGSNAAQRVCPCPLGQLSHSPLAGAVSAL